VDLKQPHGSMGGRYPCEEKKVAFETHFWMVKKYGAGHPKPTPRLILNAD
jgi:hypothetical protein